MTIDQLKFKMVDVVKYRHFMSVNARIVISALILTGCFIFMAVVTESLSLWGTLIGLGIGVIFVSLIIRVNKYDTYDYDTEASDKFMKNYLSFSDYQELKRSAEVFLGYRKDVVSPIKPNSKSESIKPEKETKKLPQTKPLDSNFLNALKDFYYLDIEDQENVILSLKGDQKVRDRLKSIREKFLEYTEHSENTLVELITFLQVIKTKVFQEVPMYILIKEVNNVFTPLIVQKSEFGEDNPELLRFLDLQKKESFTSTIFEAYTSKEDEEVYFSGDSDKIKELLNKNMRAFYTHYGT